MVGVASLVKEVELLKKDRYNKDNDHHESLLSQVSNVWMNRSLLVLDISIDV